MSSGVLPEGWYLMSVAELERELRRFRDGLAPSPEVRPISVSEALTRRIAGNLPDEAGRTLRLVLHVRSPSEAAELGRRRLEFEPDFHDAPSWRGPGSVPVNVVPLRLHPPGPERHEAWWEDPAVAALEAEWQRTGRVGGIAVPESYRSFVYKTVLALETAGRAVTLEAVCDSIARWLDPAETAALRSALRSANS